MVALAAARPRLVLSITAVCVVVAVALALRLQTSASTDTFVDPSSASYKATQTFKQNFGDDAVVVLVQGDLKQTLLTSDLLRLIGLEGCLSGNVPPDGLQSLPPVCRDFTRLKQAKAVYGPGTFINTATAQIAQGLGAQTQQAQAQADQAANAARAASASRGDPPDRQNQLADAASNLAMQQFQQSLFQLALQYGVFSLPQINNPSFVSRLVFDGQGNDLQPKPRFAYLFPTANAALIQVRLRPDLTDSQREKAVALIRSATFNPQFGLKGGGRYVVTGVPVVTDGLARAVEQALFVLLGAAVLVMALTLAVVFGPRRLRQLPLVVACVACVLCFGLVALLGFSLTMASVAAVPILIGLGVDYAIQFQARYQEVRRLGRHPPPAGTSVRAVARVGVPSIATAALATAAGFLALFLSPVPMIRGFGAILVCGVGVAFVAALVVGSAGLVRAEQMPPDLPPMFPRLRGYMRRRVRAAAGRRPIMWLWLRLVWLARAIARLYRRLLTLALERPERVLAVGLIVAVVGWAADTQTRVISDVTELVPQNLPALKDITRLERDTGLGGELDVMVRGQNLTDPAVVDWMTRFQSDVLAAHGYQPGARCAQATNPPELCPAFSLTDLIGNGGSPSDLGALLNAVPPYFSQAVITPDRRVANLAFGIRLMPLDRQRQLVSDIQNKIKPPPGVSASVVGLPALAAQANTALSSVVRRDATLLVGLCAVFLVLLAVRRSARSAAIPLIPIALASGWSALVLFCLRIPLNPMSASLGVLVIAVSTEFSVLLTARYAQERALGGSVTRAIERAYELTGRAVLASGATATAGFAVLMASDIRMLRDFGAVTTIDLAVSLAGVMVLLPAALVAAERRSLRAVLPECLDVLAEAALAIAHGVRSAPRRVHLGRKSRV